MLSRHDTGSFAATTAPSGFGLEDFERAGIRVVERRFKAKDTLFTPGDPDDQLYFLLEVTVRIYKRVCEKASQSLPSRFSMSRIIATLSQHSLVGTFRS